MFFELSRPMITDYLLVVSLSFLLVFLSFKITDCPFCTHLWLNKLSFLCFNLSLVFKAYDYTCFVCCFTQEVNIRYVGN